jgi:thiamine biosynthesis protein ThiS
MKILVNGMLTESADRSTVSELLKQLSIQSDQAAVELNLAILEPTEYENTVLKEGDKLEIIRFVGGG